MVRIQTGEIFLVSVINLTPNNLRSRPPELVSGEGVARQLLFIRSNVISILVTLLVSVVHRDEIGGSEDCLCPVHSLDTGGTTPSSPSSKTIPCDYSG